MTPSLTQVIQIGTVDAALAGIAGFVAGVCLMMVLDKIHGIARKLKKND